MIAKVKESVKNATAVKTGGERSGNDGKERSSDSN